MLSIISREETLSERLQKAIQAKAVADQAVRDVEASLQAVSPDPEALDPTKAIEVAMQERNRLQGELARQRETLDMASALVNDLDAMQFDLLKRSRQREAVEILGKQSDAAALKSMLQNRLKELDEERKQLEARLSASIAEATRYVSRLSELRNDGFGSGVGFTNTTRDEVPRKYPMRLTEWQRLWDSVHITLGLNAIDCTIDRTTGRVVRFQTVLAEIPGFELVDHDDYMEVIR